MNSVESPETAGSSMPEWSEFLFRWYILRLSNDD